MEKDNNISGSGSDVSMIVDFVDVFNLFKKYWVVFFMVVLSSMLLSVFYAFSLPPIYRAHVKIVPAPLLTLNDSPFFSDDSSRGSVSEFVQQFVDNYIELLKSASVRKGFLEANKLSGHNGGDGVSRIKVKASSRFEESKYFVVSLVGSSPDYVVKTLDAYVKFVHGEAGSFLVQEIDRRIELLTQKKDMLKSVGSEDLQNQILRLRESRLLAKKLGIFKPYDPEVIGSGVVVTSETPICFRGTKMLDEELSLLMSRGYDDIHGIGITKLKTNISYLEGLRSNLDSIKLVRFSDVSVTPQSIQIKKKVVIFYGFLLGIGLGVGVVFFQNFKEN